YYNAADCGQRGLSRRNVVSEASIHWARRVIKKGCFFSSRRRHTRWPRDWSSDVCSSDLYKCLISHAGLVNLETQWGTSDSIYHRSEERRVGKECRSRWRPDRSKK